MAFALVANKAYANESNCTISMLIPSDKAGNVVGRGGNNLKKVRDACHIRVCMDREPVVNANANAVEERLMTLQGDVINMGQAMRLILGCVDPSAVYFPVGNVMQMQFQNYPQGYPSPKHDVRAASNDPEDIQLQVAIPESLAGAILGKGGAQMKQTASATGCKVTMSTRDGMTDRQIMITGHYSKVFDAQQMIFQQLLDVNSELAEAVVTLHIRKEAAGTVIGKQGNSLKMIREQSLAKIQLVRDEVEGHRRCLISGPFMNILEAERLIIDLVKNVPVEEQPSGQSAIVPAAGMPFLGAFPMAHQVQHSFATKRTTKSSDDEQAVTKLLIPSQSAGAVIGKDGSRLKQIRESFHVAVQMCVSAETPQLESDRMLIIKGPLASRQVAVEAVLRTAFRDVDENKQCTLKVLVSPTQVGSIIGKQGCTLKALREQCGISVQVERREIMGDRLVTATGSLRQVQFAASLISMVLEHAGAPAASSDPGNNPSIGSSESHQVTSQMPQVSIGNPLLQQAMPAVTTYQQSSQPGMVPYGAPVPQMQVIAGGGNAHWY
eukprot:TRINITY_DN6149_c0_g1_i1.p1 TRINITY_DN6149_c0_g1~~TRINITY_DN6149_c0_g1_i1.p1  ORF type:complete len:619 (+),score=129.83 TRINITY_DN6149_c0_g1_i1:205-1857(+)